MGFALLGGGAGGRAPPGPDHPAAVLVHASQAGPEENFAQVLLDWPGFLEEEAFVLGGLRGRFPIHAGRQSAGGMV